MQKVFHITPVYDVLLRGSRDAPMGLYHLRLATAEQLTRLHYKAGMLTTVKARLKELADRGYLEVGLLHIEHLRQPPLKSYMTYKYYYALGTKGLQYLRGLGLDVSETARGKDEVARHWANINHTYELADMMIAAQLLGRSSPLRLYGFEHEQALWGKPYEARVASGHTIKIVPDGYLDFGFPLENGRRRRIPVLLEHDRGSEGRKKFTGKIRGYVDFFRSGAYEATFGTRAGRVAFSTFAGQERVEEMRQWTREVLAATNAPPEIAAAFYFAALPKTPTPAQAWLESAWYRLDGEMRQALLAM